MPRLCCHSPTGVKGSPIQLQANYFQLCSVPQFNIFQSCVQFEPDEERSIVRKALLASQKDVLGTGYLFDGAILFASTKLRSNVHNNSQLLKSVFYDLFFLISPWF